MPENINWNGVIQSITDFWLPLLGWIIGIILVIAIVFIVKKIKKKKVSGNCRRMCGRSGSREAVREF